MQIKKFLSWMLALLMVVSLGLSGCKQQASTGEPSGEEVKENGNNRDSGKESEVGMLGNMYKTGLPIVKDKVTLRIAARKRPLHSKEFNDMIVPGKFEEKTNVHIEWDAIPGTAWEQKKNLMFAADDLPDVFFKGLTPSDEINYGGQGMLIALDKLIGEWAPNIKNLLEKRPQVKKMCTTPSGNIYALPHVEEQVFLLNPDNFFINKTWLDKLDLPIPQTTDEFYKVLKAFKQEDPNGNGTDDEIPLSFRFGNKADGIYSLFGSFGLLDNQQHIIVENGKVVFTADKPEHKEALKYFYMLYQEGLIDQEAFTQDSKQYTAKGHNEPMLLGAFITWSHENICGTERAYNNYAFQPPLKGPGGHMMWNKYNAGVGRGGFAITSANEYPEITMRWINEVYLPENSLEWSFGPFGHNLKKNADGTYEYIETPSGKSYGEFRHSETVGSSAPAGLLKETFDRLKPMAAVKAKTERYMVYKPYFPEDIYPLVYYTSEQEQLLSTLRTDIEQYINKMQAKWIIEGGIDKDWDDYIKQLDKMRLKELLKIYQDAFNTFNKE